MDKRIRSTERDEDGACRECGRRHIHRDDCTILKQRETIDVDFHTVIRRGE